MNQKRTVTYLLWDGLPSTDPLKHGRVLGKSCLALSTNQKLDKIRERINKIYDEMLKDEGFATVQKVKLSFFRRRWHGRLSAKSL